MFRLVSDSLHSVSMACAVFGVLSSVAMQLHPLVVMDNVPAGGCFQQTLGSTCIGNVDEFTCSTGSACVPRGQPPFINWKCDEYVDEEFNPEWPELDDDEEAPQPPAVLDSTIEIKTAYFMSANPSSTGWTDRIEDPDPYPCQVVYRCKCNISETGCEKGPAIGHSASDATDEYVTGDDDCGLE